MKEITARRNLISNLKESIKEIDDKYETYTKIYNLLNDFDCDYGTDYAGYFREISDFLDDDDVTYWLELACKDGIDRIRCFVNDTYSDGLYKLDGYNNLSNVEQCDFECAIDDVISTINSDIEDLKQEEM